METSIWAQQLDHTLIFTCTFGYLLPVRAVPWHIIPFHAHAPTMATRIWAQQQEDTIIFTDPRDYHSREIQRMSTRPRPWRRPRNSYYAPHGYEIPPRMRRPQHTNIQRPVAGEAATYTYETPEQQYGENLSRRASSGLSAYCILEFLIGFLGCPITEEEICTICQDEMQTEEKTVTLPCSHMYHLSCIEKWLMIKNECAVCRASVI